MSNQKVLVTGASGFVAGHLIQYLLENKYQVRGTVRSLTKKDKIDHLLAMQEQFGTLELVEADLLKADGWAEAVAGCDIVMHTASPFITDPKDEDEVVKPAVEGTLNVLKAIAAYNKDHPHSKVKRVVVTSSIAAISAGYDSDKTKVKHVFSDQDWSNTKECGHYSKSKTLAEQAAWELWRGLSEEEKFGLSVVNPGYVQGPLMNANCGEGTQKLVASLMNGSVPAVPKICFAFVDVRDVAVAHVRAATVDAAIGQRYVCVARSLWFMDVAKILKPALESKGYKITTTALPNIALWVASFWDKQAASLLSSAGREVRMDNSKTQRDLGMTFHEPSESIVALAESLIAFKLVKPPKAPGKSGSTVGKDGVSIAASSSASSSSSSSSSSDQANKADAAPKDVNPESNKDGDDDKNGGGEENKDDGKNDGGEEKQHQSVEESKE